MTWLSIYGAYVVVAAAVTGLFIGWQIWRDVRADRRRQAIARQNATRPHPSMLRPSRDVFDQDQPNRYAVPAQREQQ